MIMLVKWLPITKRGLTSLTEAQCFHASKDRISTACIFPASLALTREFFLAEFPASEDGKIAFILLFNRSLICRWTIGQISVLNHPKLSDSKVFTIHLIYLLCLISFLPGCFAHNGRKKSGIPRTGNYFKISLFLEMVFRRLKSLM